LASGQLNGYNLRVWNLMEFVTCVSFRPAAGQILEMGQTGDWNWTGARRGEFASKEKQKLGKQES
jgi:hypothetical protein